VEGLLDARRTFATHEILIAGANGFLGKVILGLLLDRYPEFKRLHVLMRPKGRLSPVERFEKEVLGSPALQEIVSRRGIDLIREKVNVISGDLASRDCGIEASNLAGLKVDLVLNCAGLVDFFPPVDESFRSNVDGVENVVALTERLGARLLHVSTCFVCGEADGLVEETDPIPGFYPRRKGPDDAAFNHRDEIAYVRECVRNIVAFAEAGGGGPRSKQVAQRLADFGKQRASHWGWVNTYTYAKSLGEQIIAAEPALDYAIVRPAIVESAVEFPFPGWVEGGRTAAPLILMAMAGMRHWPIRENSPLEVVPVDMVAASILAVSVLLLNGKQQPVYQLGTAHSNPVLLGSLVQILHQEAKKRPARVPLPRMGKPVVITMRDARDRRIRLQRRLTRAHRIVSRLREVVTRANLPGRRPLSQLATSLRTLGFHVTIRDQMIELYRPFVLDNRFIFETENIQAGHLLLSESDRKLLPWAPERIDWNDYWVRNQIPGVEKWARA
jgi:long-chain acyl-CoA synthetase